MTIFEKKSCLVYTDIVCSARRAWFQILNLLVVYIRTKHSFFYILCFGCIDDQTLKVSNGICQKFKMHQALNTRTKEKPKTHETPLLFNKRPVLNLLKISKTKLGIKRLNQDGPKQCHLGSFPVLECASLVSQELQRRAYAPDNYHQFPN